MNGKNSIDSRHKGILSDGKCICSAGRQLSDTFREREGERKKRDANCVFYSTTIAKKRGFYRERQR